jgi:hypothetical protein
MKINLTQGQRDAWADYLAGKKSVKEMVSWARCISTDIINVVGWEKVHAVDKETDKRLYSDKEIFTEFALYLENT